MEGCVAAGGMCTCATVRNSFAGAAPLLKSTDDDAERGVADSGRGTLDDLATGGVAARWT